MKSILLIIFIMMQTAWSKGTLQDLFEQIGKGSLLVQVAGVLKGNSRDPFTNGDHKVDFTHNNMKVSLKLPIDERVKNKKLVVKKYLKAYIDNFIDVNINDSEEEILKDLAKFENYSLNENKSLYPPKKLLKTLTIIANYRTEPKIIEKINQLMEQIYNERKCHYNEETIYPVGNISQNIYELRKEYSREAADGFEKNYKGFVQCVKNTQVNEINETVLHQNSSDYEKILFHCKKENKLPNSCVVNSVKEILFQQREGKKIQCINNPKEISDLGPDEIAVVDTVIFNNYGMTLIPPESVSGKQIFTDMDCSCSSKENCCQKFTRNFCVKEYTLVNSIGFTNSLYNLNPLSDPYDNEIFSEGRDSYGKWVPSSAGSVDSEGSLVEPE